MFTADMIWATYAHLIDDIGVSDMNRDVRAKWADTGELATSHMLPSAGHHTFNVGEGDFGLTTIKHVPWKKAIQEIRWIYQDKSNDVNLLEEKYGIKWWRPWANEQGTIGHSYGWQIANRERWVDVGDHWEELDQMDWLIYKLKTSPDRRMIMSMFSPEDEYDKALQECAYETIWTVRGDELNMMLIQRSSDYFVAGAINQFQYCALLAMVAHATGYKVGVMEYVIADLHMYDRHREQVMEISKREPKEQPKVKLKEDAPKDFYSITEEHFEVEYESYPPDKMDVAI